MFGVLKRSILDPEEETFIIDIEDEEDLDERKKRVAADVGDFWATRCDNPSCLTSWDTTFLATRGKRDLSADVDFWATRGKREEGETLDENWTKSRQYELILEIELWQFQMLSPKSFGDILSVLFTREAAGYIFWGNQPNHLS